MVPCRNYLPSLILMLLIFVESSIPMVDGEGNIAFLIDFDPQFQNFLHIPLYGSLAFLWLNGFHKNGIRFSLAWKAALGITFLYGCLDEMHQTLVPGRYGGLADLYLNMIGAVLGVVVYAKATFWMRSALRLRGLLSRGKKLE